jgi:hypothetical protein
MMSDEEMRDTKGLMKKSLINQERLGYDDETSV